MRTHCLHLGGQLHAATATPAAGVADGDSGILSQSTVTCTCVKATVLYVTVHDTPLPAAIADLPEVLEAVDDLTDWLMLGLQLGLHYPTLKRIRHDRLDLMDECKMEMLAAWLQQKDNVSQIGVPSWSVLRAALRGIGERELADKLLCKYCNVTS